MLWRDSAFFRVGMIILLLLLLLVASEPVLRVVILKGADPLEVGTGGVFEPRSWQHPLGTGRMGTDILVLTVMGLRYSLIIGALGGAIATALGIIVGFVAGYKGGWLDGVLRTGTDMVLVIPSFPILAVLSAYVVNLNVVLMSVLLAAFSWPFVARTIRSQVMSLRERPYIDLAKISNMGDLEIIFGEIVPNVLPYLGVVFANSVIGVILAEVGIELIGLGPPKLVTLGLLINWGLGWGMISLNKPDIIVVPATLLILLFMALNFINIGLENTYNPRLRGITGA